MRNTLALLSMSVPYLFMAFQHYDNLFNISLVCNVEEVIHVTPILWWLGRLLFSIDLTVFRCYRTCDGGCECVE